LVAAMKDQNGNEFALLATKWHFECIYWMSITSFEEHNDMNTFKSSAKRMDLENDYVVLIILKLSQYAHQMLMKY